MKTRQFKRILTATGLILLFIAGSLTAQEISKKVEKKYPVDPGTVLNISNKFGKVDVRNWNQNTIEVLVEIRVEHPQTDRAEKFLEAISVKERKEGNQIFLETEFSDDFGKFSSSNMGSQRKSFSVDYTLQVPPGLNLNLNNRFGDVFIAELTGLVNLDIKFGKLEANRIMRGNEKPRSTVTLAHGQGFINETDWLALDIRYYDLDITGSTALIIESKHSKINIKNASSVVSESGYDVVKIGSLNNFVGEGSYTTLQIGTLTRKLELETRYGKCTINNIPPGFESISIEGAYTQFDLGISPQASYELSGEASFSKIKVPDNSRLNREIRNTSMSLSGKVGSGDAKGSSVRINTSFGDVILMK